MKNDAAHHHNNNSLMPLAGKSGRCVHCSFDESVERLQVGELPVRHFQLVGGKTASADSVRVAK